MKLASLSIVQKAGLPLLGSQMVYSWLMGCRSGPNGGKGGGAGGGGDGLWNCAGAGLSTVFGLALAVSKYIM
jgi:hypothetical protein